MPAIDIKVPDIGDFKDVAVIELLVKPGDTVKAEQSLLTVESDKASMEIPSSHAGVVKELKVKIGDKVSEGSSVMMLETAGDSVRAEPVSPTALSSSKGAPAPASTPAPAPAPAQPSPQPSPGGGGGNVEVVVPDIGDFDEVAVIEVLVKPG